MCSNEGYTVGKVMSESYARAKNAGGGQDQLNKVYIVFIHAYRPIHNGYKTWNNTTYMCF